MRFTDTNGRKIETRSGEDVIAEDGFPTVDLYINGKFVDSLAMMWYSPENVANVEACLFDEYGIEMCN
jgi:hypothetical protein